MNTIEAKHKNLDQAERYPDKGLKIPLSKASRCNKIECRLVATSNVEKPSAAITDGLGYVGTGDPGDQPIFGKTHGFWSKFKGIPGKTAKGSPLFISRCIGGL